jgi:cell division protein FtsW (lipid II flippase)
MEIHDRYGGLFWLLFCIFVCKKSLEVGVGTFQLPGSGFLPFWSAVGFGTLSLILVMKSFFVRKDERKTLRSVEGKRSKVILVLVSLFLYVILLERGGYVIMTFGLMAFLFIVAGKSKVWVHIVSAVVAVLATYLIFCVWLGVPLPKGILDF